jgi:predicted metal-binding protein
MPIVEVTPVIDYSVRSLCASPYPGHKHGCPNFNKKRDCPPFAPLFDRHYDITKPVYAIYCDFNLAKHVEAMREKHPDWTYKQLSCLLYWQNGVKKKLARLVEDFLFEHVEYSATVIPEAMGVDMIKTMAAVGVNIHFPPQDIVYKIALAGIPK